MNIKPLDILQKILRIYKFLEKDKKNIIKSIINKEDVLAIMPTVEVNLFVTKYLHFVFRWNDYSYFSINITYERSS